MRGADVARTWVGRRSQRPTPDPPPTRLPKDTLSMLRFVVSALLQIVPTETQELMMLELLLRSTFQKRMLCSGCARFWKKTHQKTIKIEIG